ncbi:EAL domain-containing protein [Pelomonas sp. V22]|uniref:sensor domain-containing protein n=1 Tax=Pelomonas sp. V22 TaxID=2822139 RepID=UPI0024A93BA7|nr:bifunctional diguanylate cyclase/phosphodiesterase [Pelomonas sp. V22]MDI4635896.1 EAL domain-containing protein [Pelomonas sp. V22]
MDPLSSSLEVVDQILEATPAIGGRIDSTGRIRFANGALAKSAKQRPEDLVGRSLADLVCINCQKVVLQNLTTALQGRKVSVEADICLGAQDVPESMQLRFEPLMGAGWSSEGLVFLGESFARGEQSSKGDSWPNNLLQTLNEHAIVAVADLQGTITYANERFCQISKYTKTELLGQNHRILKSGHHDAHFYEAMWTTISGGQTWRGDVCNRAKDGSLYWVHTTIVPFLDGHGLPAQYVSIRVDITALKAAQQRAHQLAYYDQVTDLPNRRSLREALAERKSPLFGNGTGALVLIDVDNFRVINDVHGHFAGDAYLRSVAGRVEGLLKEGHLRSNVFHLGGDEFVILTDLQGLDLDSTNLLMTGLITGLQEELSNTHRISDGGSLVDLALSCSLSAGVVFFETPLAEQVNLLEKADVALVEAKDRGKNQVVYFDQHLRDQLQERHELEKDLRQALHQGQFHLAYQPIVDQGNHVVGAEALMRWTHPDRGAISPGVFIPLAEQMRLINAMGWWVIEQACLQLQAWQANPVTCDWWVSVNVSARQLKDPAFLDQLMQFVKRQQFPLQLLALELTETSLLDDLSSWTLDSLAQLRDLGIQLALDDFGTGFSSLMYLKELPLTKIKIDQSFVRTLLDNPKDQLITQSILTLANGLGLAVVAEGVETEEQLQYLKSVGCPLFQGYLFSRPTFAERLLTLVLPDRTLLPSRPK